MPPTSLIESLQAVRRKVRGLAIVSGASVSLAALVGLLVGAVFLDWTLSLDKLPRLMLLAAGLVGVGYVLWHWLIEPATARLELGDVAGRLEHTFPQFDDRLRSSVNFSQASIPGSAQMQQRVMSEAARLAQSLNFEQVIVRRPVYLSSAGAAASIIVLGLLMAWGGRAGWLRIAANRLVLGDDQWPKSVEISLDGEIPRLVPVGQKIPLKLHLTKGDKESRKAFVYYRYDNGPWKQELMKRSGGAYTALLGADLDAGHKNGLLEVRVESGDDSQTLSPIAIVPRLDVKNVTAEITPPPYIQPATPTLVSLSEHPATVAAGSTVRFHFAFNKSLKEASAIELRSTKDGQTLPAMTWDRSAGDGGTATFEAAESFRFTVRATDVDGFQNPGVEEYELIVKEDQPPSVQIEEPSRPEDRTPAASFKVRALAEDDHAVVAAQLVVDRATNSRSAAPATQPANGAAASAATTSHWVIDLVKDGAASAASAAWTAADGSLDRRRYHLNYIWDLSSLKDAKLKTGDVLEFYVQVKDNFLLHGKDHDWVPSGKLSLTIISQEQWEQKAQAEAERVQQLINAERLNQLRQKAETETVKSGLERNKKFDQADKAQVNRLSNDQLNTQAQAMQLAERLDTLVQRMQENKSPEGGLRQTAESVSKDLKNAADAPMRDARQKLDEAKDASAKSPNAAKDAAGRAEKLTKAAESQQKSAEMLQKAMDRLGQMGGLSESIATIQRLREQQEKLEKQFQADNKDNVSKRPEELSQADQERNKQHADQQNEMARQLEQALNNMDAKADKMAKSDPASSAAMKQAARMGKQSNLQNKQEQAAKDMQQNQQAQAQQNQKQVEIGLDQILNTLHEAERRKLEELARQLAELQQLVNDLILRQAGHNIDNLLIQGGPARFQKLNAKERDELVKLAGREGSELAGSQNLGQLTPGQEQTEANARDIAKQAESLPDPSASAKLTQAAGHMERAVVHLRDGKPADAYQPPQVDALATLREAKKDIDAANKQVQDKLDEQDAETIKQAYVKLLEEQKKVGVELRRIDKTPKDDNGDLPRADSVKLAQLPTDQGKLIEAATKIGEQIKQLDSIVYDWANHDIIKSMGTVKDNLGKPDTGHPTQVAEKQIEDQLQAMIDSLVQHLNKSNFDQRNNGGGGAAGGGNKPKLPSEAELRLLKKNQEAINSGTAEQDAKSEKDKEELLRLGSRQGEMRNLLDQLVQKASRGQTKLGPEPDPKEQLPEEASKDDVDNQEIQDDLLHDKVSNKTVDKGLKSTGDRMARSRQRLALNNDPGKVTQEIQKRVLLDLDDLIKMAQQSQSQSQSKPGKGEKMGQPQPKPGQGQQQTAKGQKPGQQRQPGSTPAQGSTDPGDRAATPDPSADVTEKRSSWGGITPRERQAVQESAGEQVIGKYKTLVDDYYRSLAEKSGK